MENRRLPRILFVPPPFWYVLAFLAGMALDRWPGLPRLESELARRTGAVLVVAALVALVLPAMWQFLRARTTLAPPTLHTPKALLTQGPYRFSRNPLYLALAVIYSGIALWAERLGPLLLLPLAVWLIARFVIAHEERFLEEHFGDEYRQYRRRVRRWL